LFNSNSSVWRFVAFIVVELGFPEKGLEYAEKGLVLVVAVPGRLLLDDCISSSFKWSRLAH
jgi:hypothetical protein